MLSEQIVRMTLMHVFIFVYVVIQRPTSLYLSFTKTAIPSQANLQKYPLGHWHADSEAWTRAGCPIEPWQRVASKHYFTLPFWLYLVPELHCQKNPTGTTTAMINMSRHWPSF
jgi:hypothetical protein